MIGEKIPKDDAYWSNFLCLLSIMDYIFAPILSEECIGHLKYLINEHHSKFVELYLSHVTPKMHYMVHYPEIIERYTFSDRPMF